MTHEFDKEYWEQHWDGTPPDAAHDRSTPPNPYVVNAVDRVPPSTVLDAGCGRGAEAVWLAQQGWRVTGADISSHALESAAERARAASVDDRVSWVETDLTTWQPQQRWQLVITNYAHPTMGQLEFYRRIAGWVAPGGSLLIVGHRHDPSSDTHHHHEPEPHHHESEPPAEATVDLAAITDLFDADRWRIDTAEEHTRILPTSRGQTTLHDVVVLATCLT